MQEVKQQALCCVCNPLHYYRLNCIIIYRDLRCVLQLKQLVIVSAPREPQLNLGLLFASLEPQSNLEMLFLEA